MHILYIDESGDTGQLPAQPGANDQPVFVIGALIVDAAKIGDLTRDFIDLKTRFYPGLVGECNKHLDRILPEIKGSDLRRNALRGRHNVRRHAVGFLSKLAVLRHMGWNDRTTIHGFRALASSVLHEAGFDHNHIERQLAHAERNKIAGAYNYMAQYMPQRIEMMQWWGDFLDRVKDGGGQVLPFRTAAGA